MTRDREWLIIQINSMISMLVFTILNGDKVEIGDTVFRFTQDIINLVGETIETEGSGPIPASELD